LDDGGGKRRVLPIGTGVLVAAQAYLAVRRELVHGVDRGALLLTERGTRLGVRRLQVLLRRLSQVVGFYVHLHLLRHSLAVHLLRRGLDIRYIQEFLGHAELNTTKVYLRMVPGYLREEYDRAMPVIVVNGSAKERQDMRL
jgi:site-specific recombinase XerD